MVLKRAHRREELSYIQWIEKFAHKKLHARKVHPLDYIYGGDICDIFYVDQNDLIAFVKNSDTVHGILCASGALFIHPDGFIRHMNEWRKTYAPGTIPRNPITKKEFSLH